jgi:ankyrin repeat protein
MEAVGPVIGIAGLFSACLEAVEKVQSYRTFGADSSTLETRLQAAKVLLEQWGRSVGFENGSLSAQHSPKLDELDTEVAVKGVLEIIKTICDVANPHHAAHGLIGPSSGSRRQKLKWAFGDKQKQEEQVELLEILVHQLRQLVPAHDLGPETAKSHASIAEIQAMLTRIEKEARGILQAVFQLNKRLTDTTKPMYTNILSWIGHGRTDQRYKDSLQKKQPGTCDWIYGRPVFQSWLAPDFVNSFQALWINGPAGFGKTVLCASIVDHLATTLREPTAHFFLTAESQSRDDPFLAVRAWIAQVISQHRGAFDCAHHAWEDDLDPVSSQETCLGLLNQIAQLVPGCTFVVDGLDESTHLDTHSTSATTFLEAITASLSTSSSRMLLVSRDEPRIRNATAEHFTEYTILPDDVRADTASVSQEIINRKLNQKTVEFHNSLSEAMATRCGGQFLWLKLQEESLRNGMNMKKLKGVVEGTPPGLEAVYEREWSRIARAPDYERIVSLLRWTAFAIRSLTVGELTEAVFIGGFDDFPMDDLPDEIDDDYVETEIVGLCAPLIQTIHRRKEEGTDSSVGLQTVHLAHFSVKQSLLLQFPVPVTIRINEGLRSQYHNTLLATACLHYINFRQTWKDESDDQPSLGVALRNYAAGSWHHHFHAGLTNDETVLNLITALFNERNWAWGFWRSWLQKQVDGSFTASGYGTADETNNFAWWDGRTSGPVYYAIGLRLGSVASKLISNNTSSLRNMLDLARAAVVVTQQVGQQDMLEKLLQSGVSARTATINGTTLLHYAAGWNSPQVAQTLIDKGADVSATNNEGFTPLHLARNLEMTRTLLDNGAMVDVQRHNGSTALHSASTWGLTAIVDLLLDSGATVDARNKSGFTLHLACWAGHTGVAKRLIAGGASLTASCTGSAPLHIACILSRNEVVELLIHDGACIDEIWTDSTRPIHWAAKEGQYETVKLLLDSGAKIEEMDNYGNLPLHLACYKDQTEVIKLLIGAGADIEALDTNGFTPLAVSCFYGSLDAMDLLMAAGSELSRIIDSHGETLLNSALAQGYTKIISLLVDKGVSLTEPDKDGFQAMIYAAAYGRTELIELFVEKGASILVTDKNGWNPLHHACRHGYLEIVKILLDSGSDLMSRDNSGLTCLHHACCGESLELVRFLLEKGIKVWDRAVDGPTPLYCAATEGSIEIVEFLIAKGALIHEVMDDARNGIEAAAVRGQFDILKSLLDGSPRDEINNCRTTAGEALLHLVTRMNRGQSVESLLRIPSIKPDQTDSLGCTALFLASRYGFGSIVQTLLSDTRVDPNMRDWHGSTALFAAVRNGHLGVTEILLKNSKVVTGGTDGFRKDIWWWADKIGN